MRHDSIGSYFDDVMEYDDEEPEIRHDFIRGRKPVGRTAETTDQSEASSSDDVTDGKIENLKKMLAESMNIEIKQSNINIYM